MIRKSTRGEFWVLEGDQFISRWAEESGRLDHDRSALPKILEHIEKGNCIVDVGAQIGSHSRAYLDAVGSSGCVYSFEPHPWAYRALVLNCPEAKTYQLALGDQFGRSELILNETNPGASYLSDEKNCSHLHREPVFMIPLDALTLTGLNLLKMDCESSELEVLRGAVETIRRCRPTLVSEVNACAQERAGTSRDELLDFIRSLGYTQIRNIYQNQKMEGQQFDIICQFD